MYGFSGLFALIRLDRVGPPHRDLDADQSRLGVVVVVVVVISLFTKIKFLIERRA